MCVKRKGFSERFFVKRVTHRAKRMNNNNLRNALWQTRKKIEEHSDISGDNKDKLLISEGIYAEELKKRELLEWALRTGKDNKSE